MDPVGSAIISTLIAGVTMGFSEVAMDFISEKYKLLVQKIQKKFGGNKNVMNALSQLENNPKSVEFQDNLNQQFETFKVNQEKEFQLLAKDLLQALNKIQTSNQNVQNIYGNHNAVAGSGGMATITNNFNFEAKKGEPNESNQ